MLDTATIRAQFPALQRTVNGQPVIYADNPGGTQVPQAVADAVSHYLLHRNANTQGVFLTSRLTDETIKDARLAMADLLNASGPEEIVFGPNMTTLNFQVMHTLAHHLEADAEVVVTQMDHDANYTPWLALTEWGAKVQRVTIRTEDVTLDLDDLSQKISPRTRLVAFGHASNATGTVNPVAHIVEVVRALAPHALIVLDAVQSVPHLPVDVQTLGCDLVTCSSYKFFGPHMGILWGRPEVLEMLQPYKVRPAKASSPDKFETGTKNHEGLAGIVAAVQYLTALVGETGLGEPRRNRLQRAMSAIRDYEQLLSRHFLERVAALPHVKLYGIRDPERVTERVPTFALTVDGMPPQISAKSLGARGIFCWAGHYYAVEVMEALRLAPNGALRLGFVHYNTVEEIERVMGALAGMG